MAYFVPLSDVFSSRLRGMVGYGGRRDCTEQRTKGVSFSTSQVASVLREKPKRLEAEMSESQGRRETVVQQRRRFETKPMPLEGNRQATSRRNQTAAAGVGR